MYYLRVTGQISSSGKRTEIPKTDPSYRVVPLSAELGQMLTARRQELEKMYGDLTLMLRCGKPEGENFRTDPTAISASVKEVTEQVPKLLRQPQILKELKENRPYRFNEVCQDRYLISMVTCHALRRNFCSWLYCSGIGTKEVFRQMGHADKSVKRRSGPLGATPEELYRICLQKQVRPTLYHPAQSLRYPAGGKIRETEVPACVVELTLPPQSSWELVVSSTEADDRVNFAGEGLVWEVCRQEACKPDTDRYELLAAEEVYTIREKRKLFG